MIEFENTNEPANQPAAEEKAPLKNIKEELTEKLIDLIRSMNKDIERISTSSYGDDEAILIDYGLAKKQEVRKQLESEIKKWNELEKFIVSIIQKNK